MCKTKLFFFLFLFSCSNDGSDSGLVEEEKLSLSDQNEIQNDEDKSESPPRFLTPLKTFHFFTIVYNGKPWIDYHYPVLKSLPFPWTWTIVEGVANRVKDSSWMNPKNDLTEEFDLFNLSTDGTTETLNHLLQLDSDHIQIVRNWNPYLSDQVMPWDGKIEMVNAALKKMETPGIVMQIDADELWTSQQLKKIYHEFLDQNYCFLKYKADYFFGPQLVLPKHSFSHSWYRTWNFEPGDLFKTHCPPVLKNQSHCQGALGVEETEVQNLIFQHYGYVIPEQAHFKTQYYGDSDFETNWRNLQSNTFYPVLAKDFFPKFPIREEDPGKIFHLNQLDLNPLAFQDIHGNWNFQSPQKKIINVAVDGRFYEITSTTGIAQVWTETLKRWEKTFSDLNVIYIKRGDSDFPPFEVDSERVISLPATSSETDVDIQERLRRELLERDVDVFTSTYYTIPPYDGFPVVSILYDMIPEIFNLHPEWQEEKGIWFPRADRVLSISRYSADVACEKFYQGSKACMSGVKVSHPGVSPEFHEVPALSVKKFLKKKGIRQPYFLFVGLKNGYKNCELIKKFLRLKNKPEWVEKMSFVQIGGHKGCFCEGSVKEDSSRYFFFQNINQEDLNRFYAGADALIYPSTEEGFGLPILEAFASGTPVVLQKTSVFPEVAHSFGFYYLNNNPKALLETLNFLKGLDQEEKATRLRKASQYAKNKTWDAFANRFAVEIRDAYLKR